MKKGQIIEGVISHVDFPNKGIILTEEGKQVIVKHGIAGQKVSAAINKIRKGKCEGRLLCVLEKSPLELAEPECIHAKECGGCTYQSLPYENQIVMKAQQVKKLLDEVILPEYGTYEFLGIKPSPNQQGYRNKMEFSFGDEWKDGPLALGMHKRGSFYDIVNVPECQIADEDFRTVLKVTLSYFKEKNISYYHKLRHTGFLRHLLVRKAVKTGELLVDLVTTSQIEDKSLLEGWKNALLEKDYCGKLIGVLHTKNDSVADTIKNEGTDILFGQDFFYEELLGLRFKITPFSFFQTNSLGAEVLYQTVREFIGDALMAGKNEIDFSGKAEYGFMEHRKIALNDERTQDFSESHTNTKQGEVVFDLYSGTGTIAQILAPIASKVIGVEIVEEAVEAAKENAEQNGLHNCEFIAGDVLKSIDTIAEKPDYIVLDPPRDGIHPKALEKIGATLRAKKILYIACKPTSLARDLVKLQEYGYVVDRVCCVDMFPQTEHVETICLLTRIK